MEKGRLLLGKLVFVIAVLMHFAFRASALDVNIDAFNIKGTNWTHYAPVGRVALYGFTGGTTYYTMDGTTPSRSSILYTNSLVLTNSVLLRAITYSSGTFVQTHDVQFNFPKVHTLRVTVDGSYSPLKFVEIATNGVDFLPLQARATAFAAGQVVALRVVERDGWFFDRWKGLYGTTNRTNVVTMTSTFEARLSLYRNDLDIPAPEGNGRVVIDRAAPFFMSDPDVQVTAMPDEGYYFAGWNQPAASVGAISYAQRLDVPIKKATFLPLPENNFSLSAQVDGRGDIIARNNRFVGPENELATLTFVTRFGWKPDGWSGDALAGQPTATNTVVVRLDTNKSVVARSAKVSVFTPERFMEAVLHPGESGNPQNRVPLVFQSPARADDGTLVIGAVAGNQAFIEGFDRDGYNIWEARSTAWPGIAALAQPSIGPNGVVYVPEPTTDPTIRGWVSGYSLKGEFLFRISNSGATIPNLCLNQNGLYIGCPYRRLQRYSLDGTLVAEIPAEPDQAGLYYSLAPNGDLIASQTVIKRYNRRLELRAQGDPVGAPQIFIAPDYKIYFNSPTYGMSSNLARIWTNFASAKTASVGISQIYITDASGRLGARRITDGFLQWTFNDPYPNSAFRRAIALADGNLIAVFSNNTIRKISSLGTVMWEMSGLNDPDAEPILTDDGILHAGLEGYDIGVGPALSGFPMLHGDWRRSGAAYVGPLPVVNELTVTGEGSARNLLFTPGTLKTLVLESTDRLGSAWTTVRTFAGPLDYPFNATGGPRYFRVVFP
jgi:hypothetical protein